MDVQVGVKHSTNDFFNMQRWSRVINYEQIEHAKGKSLRVAKCRKFSKLWSIHTFFCAYLGTCREFAERTSFDLVFVTSCEIPLLTDFSSPLPGISLVRARKIRTIWKIWRCRQCGREWQFSWCFWAVRGCFCSTVVMLFEFLETLLGVFSTQLFSRYPKTGRKVGSAKTVNVGMYLNELYVLCASCSRPPYFTNVFLSCIPPHNRFANTSNIVTAECHLNLQVHTISERLHSAQWKTQPFCGLPFCQPSIPGSPTSMASDAF